MIIMLLFWLVSFIVVIGIIVLIIAATRPDSFRYERQMTINAAPEKIFPWINDFHKWADWSPYEKMDLTMKKTYSGSASGTGAIFEWLGNNKVGSGRMEIIEAIQPSVIKIKLDFMKPFEAHNIAEFTLQSQGVATLVTWAMSGSNPLMAKVMGIFVSMDKLVGKDFETGLANLKSLAEK